MILAPPTDSDTQVLNFVVHLEPDVNLEKLMTVSRNTAIFKFPLNFWLIGENLDLLAPQSNPPA